MSAAAAVSAGRFRISRVAILGLFIAIALAPGIVQSQSCTFSDTDCDTFPALTNSCAANGGTYSGSTVSEDFDDCPPLQDRAICDRPAGFICGASSCRVCNGNGSCINESLGTPCGSEVDDECTEPDSCDSFGSCLPNNELAGLDCSLGGCTSGGMCAVPTHFFAQGLVTSSNVPGVSIGDPLSLEYAFSALTPDASTSTSFGSYPAVISAVGLTPGRQWVWSGEDFGSISVSDESRDLYRFRVSSSLFLELFLQDNSGTALASDELPAEPPDLESFQTLRNFLFRENSEQVNGVVILMEFDACPYYSTPNNDDTDGNGIGDDCECGDQNGDGTVDVMDLLAINAAIFNPALATPLCDTNDDGLCDVQDVLGANAKLFGSPAYCSRYPSP